MGYSQSSDATLKSLTTSTGDWNHPYNPDDWLYTIKVAHEANTIQVTPAANHKKAAIRVNGTEVQSGSASSPIDLAVGSNEIGIVVTAETGKENSYLLTVLRSPSNNAHLASLDIEGVTLDPMFDPLTTEYQTKVDPLLESVRIIAIAQAADEGAQVYLAIDDVGPLESDQVALGQGDTSVRITVIAPDEVSLMTYQLMISKQSSDPQDAYLATLSIEQVSLTPPFDADNPQETEYSGSVPGNLSSIRLRVEPVSALAQVAVFVNDTLVEDTDNLALVVGENIITIKVTSGDGLTIKEYHINLDRASASDVAELADIEISMGQNGTQRPLYQTGFVPDQVGFDPQVLTYGAVIWGFEEIQITATAEDPGISQLTIDGAGTPIDGKTTQTISLVEGEVKDIAIVSTSQDGSTSLTYHLLVRLLNGVEFYYGIYASVQRVSKAQWYERVDNSPDLGLDEEFTGAAHGTMHWTIKLAGLQGRNRMDFDHYNNGSQGFPYLDDGWYEHGRLESMLSIQGNGTQTGELQLFTHQDYADPIGLISYHLTVVEKQTVAGEDSYSECTYLGNVYRFYYSPEVIHESLADGWDPYQPWTPEDFQ